MAAAVTTRSTVRNDPAFRTTHNLIFESTPAELSDPLGKFHRFRVGTCTGIWGYGRDCYFILAIHNSSPHNGHFEDVLEWFEHSCIRDKKDLAFLQIMNPRFGEHLQNKRHFAEWYCAGEYRLVKRYQKMITERQMKAKSENIGGVTT